MVKILHVYFENLVLIYSGSFWHFQIQDISISEKNDKGKSNAQSVFLEDYFFNTFLCAPCKCWMFSEIFKHPHVKHYKLKP